MITAPAPMHIPDGFLSLVVSVFCWLVAAAVLSIALTRTNKNMGEGQIPMMGVMAAFIFAAQMINFPVAGGTSGHILGGVLVAILLGPWAGMLVMTAVLVVQGFLFQDGGLLAMGANILNIGLLPITVGYGLYRLVQGCAHSARLAAAGLSAWLSVMTGALVVSLELWLSGTAVLQIIVPTMLGVHALVGLGEALLTVATLAFIQKVRPDLLETRKASAGGRGWIVAGMLLAAVVVVLSPLASTAPDGLERVAIDLGFMGREQAAPEWLNPGFTLRFLGGTPLATILAGILGVLVAAGLAFLAARLIQKRGKKT